MPDLTLTAANIKPSPKAVRKDGTAGATIVAGNVLAFDATGKLVLADANSATAALRTVEGIALNGASDGQPLKYVQSDPLLEVGTILTTGTSYMLSGTPGQIAPDTDAASGDYVTVLGVAHSNHELNLNPTAAGAAKP